MLAFFCAIKPFWLFGADGNTGLKLLRRNRKSRTDWDNRQMLPHAEKTPLKLARDEHQSSELKPKSRLASSRKEAKLVIF